MKKARFVLKHRPSESAILASDYLSPDEAVLGEEKDWLPVLTYKDPHVDSILRARFSPDGRYIASAGVDGTLCIFDVVHQEFVGTAVNCVKGVNDICWDASSRFLYVADCVGACHVVSIALLGHGGGKSRGNAFLVDSWVHPLRERSASSGGGGGSLGESKKVHEKRTQPVGSNSATIGSSASSPTPPQARARAKAAEAAALAPVFTAVCSPRISGSHVFTGGYDETIRVWDLRHTGAIASVRAHDDMVVSLELSSDDRVLLSCGLEGIFRLWRAADQTCLKSSEAVGENVSSYATFSPNGRFVLCGNGNPGISKSVIWDITRRRACRNLVAPEGEALTSIHGNQLHTKTFADELSREVGTQDGLLDIHIHDRSRDLLEEKSSGADDIDDNAKWASRLVNRATYGACVRNARKLEQIPSLLEAYVSPALFAKGCIWGSFAFCPNGYGKARLDRQEVGSVPLLRGTGAQIPTPGVHIFDVFSGLYCGGLSALAHDNYATTHVEGLPIEFGVPAIVTSGDYPNSSVVLWRYVAASERE